MNISLVRKVFLRGVVRRALVLGILLCGFVGFGQNLDYRILKGINEFQNTGLDRFAKASSWSVAPVAISAPVGMFILGLVEHDDDLLNKSYVVGFSFGATMAETYVLKWAVNRPRPIVDHADIRALEGETTQSFPSGHTSAAFSTATSLSLVCPKWYVIVPSYAWAVSAGYSRMRLGVHYPTDVLAGAVLGAGSAWLTYKGNQWLQKRRGGKRS